MNDFAFFTAGIRALAEAICDFDRLIARMSDATSSVSRSGGRGSFTVIELGGINRVVEGDGTAILIVARAAEEFAKESLPEALRAPAEDVVSGQLKKIDLPEDDFNRRVIPSFTGSDPYEPSLPGLTGNPSFSNGGAFQRWIRGSSPRMHRD